MRVRDILRQKGSDVATIEGKATLADAVRIFRERGIGAVVVAGPKEPVAGLLSERDVVRALADRGASVLGETVSSVMTTAVETCEPEVPVTEVMASMTEGRFRHMPVVEDGRLAGIISIGDVVKHRLDQLETETDHLKQYITTG